MSLSDREKEILEQIENGLKGSDPDLVETVSSTNIYNFSGKKIWFWVSISVASLIVFFVCFLFYYLLALIPFFVFIFSLYKIFDYLSKVSKATVEEAKTFVNKKKSEGWRWDARKNKD